MKKKKSTTLKELAYQFNKQKHRDHFHNISKYLKPKMAIKNLIEKGHLVGFVINNN